MAAWHDSPENVLVMQDPDANSLCSLNIFNGATQPEPAHESAAVQTLG